MNAPVSARSLAKPQRMITKSEARAQLVRLDRFEADASLRNFVPLAWPQLEPEAKYVGGWAIDAMCDHLEAVTYGWVNRLLINVPPGSMKSLLSSVMWPAWEWGPRNKPSLRYIATAFNDGPVKRDTRKMRDLVASPWYQERWPKVALVRAGETSFSNTRTGNREGIPFGSLTSQRADRLIIDDPHSTMQAESQTERSKTVRQFCEGAVNRLNDQEKSAIIVIMQRLHEADMSGEILSRAMGYDHLMLPMEFEPDRRCVTRIGFRDPRTEEGELLNPERFSRAVVDQLKHDMGEYAFCTPAESPVLMSDLSLRPIAKVQVGDTVVGFGIDTENGAQRKHLIPVKVVAISKSVRQVYKLTMSSGKVIRCTKDHKWYTGRSGDREQYRQAKVGDRLMRVCDDVMPELKPWQVRDAAWLAGFFDADGSVSKMQKADGHRASYLIQFTQGSGRNLPICDKLERVLDSLGFAYNYKEREPVGREHCYNYKVRQYYLTGNSLSLFQKFLHCVEPVKWRDRIEAGGYRNKFITAKEVVMSMVPDGEETVYGLTTESGNYVVWGFASSNSGQYQQRPVPREGGLFKREWFEGKIVRVAPAGTQWVRHYDLAATKDAGAWTAGVKLGKTPDGKYVVGHVDRLRETGDVVRKRIKAVNETDRLEDPNCLLSLPQDGGQAGKVQKGDMATYLAGVRLSFLLEGSLGDKETRAEPFSIQCEAGNVTLVGGPDLDAAWIKPYLDELCMFPGGKYKDQVDATSGAFAQLTLGPQQQQLVGRYGGR